MHHIWNLADAHNNADQESKEKENNNNIEDCERPRKVRVDCGINLEKERKNEKKRRYIKLTQTLLQRNIILEKEYF